MKKTAAALFLFVSMAVIALPASATPVTYTLDFTSAQGPAYGGFDIANYNFTITNDNTSLQTTAGMMCIDYNREINFNETWNAILVPITGVLPNDPAPTLTHDPELEALEADAILFNEIQNTTDLTERTDLQYAAWSFSATPAQLADSAQFHSAALADATNAIDALTNASNPLHNSVNFADYAYFDPTDFAPNSDPQRFLVYVPGLTTPGHPNFTATPEPSSLMLLGTGVLGLASIARRRILKA